MSATERACYGAMFPDLTRLEYNQPCRGKAFAVDIAGHGMVAQSRELAVDQASWAACTACPDYRSCYDLCIAKLMLQQAMASV